MRKIIEKIIHMIKTKDCKHICLFCEYYEMCSREVKAEREDKKK